MVPFFVYFNLFSTKKVQNNFENKVKFRKFQKEEVSNFYKKNYFKTHDKTHIRHDQNHMKNDETIYNK